MSNKGKIITDQYNDVEVGASVIVRHTEYGSTIINTYPTGQYVDEVDSTRLAEFVELDKDESELQVKRTMNLDEFGAMLGIPVVHVDGKPSDIKEVKTGGLNGRVGCKTNKK